MSHDTIDAPEETRDPYPVTLRDTSVWSDGLVASAGIPTRDSPVVSVGGGLGSFALVDFLRVAGVPREAIRVLSPMSHPADTLRHLCESSQIGLLDPMRSDSMSRIDNIWGWPSYAFTEARRYRSVKPLLRVLTEPLAAEFFNPRAETVYRGLDREANRIGWSDMLVRGQAAVVRRREHGGYFVLLEQLSASGGVRPVAYRCRNVHLAIGYPAIRLLPDLRDYRARYGDFYRVVHAYQPHLHVYETLCRRPGTVVVRGSGITASRVLQRLIDDRRAHGAETTIIHVFRNYVAKPQGPPWFRRDGGDGFSYQSFTFPKASGGGQLRNRVLKVADTERAALVMAMGGATTAKRRMWRRQLAAGRREGWYEALSATIVELRPGPDGKVAVELLLSGGRRQSVSADYVIDATGLEADVRQHPLLADLLEHGGASLGPLGRLDVDPHFEVRGTRSGVGCMYASGPITLGGYLAPVDSFWGLEHAALEICDDLARQGECARIGIRRSIAGWWRWMRNTPI